MTMMINTPPSTIGYKKNKYIVAWQHKPLSKDEVIKIAEKDQFGDTSENMKTPSMVNIAVGYTLVKENRRIREGKFSSYIVPTKEASTKHPDFRRDG